MNYFDQVGGDMLSNRWWRITVVLILVTACGCGGSGGGIESRDVSESRQESNHRATAVTLSLQKFFSGNWGLRDQAIYIAPGPYSKAVPKQLAGKPVEIISEEDLITRFRGREVAPEIVRINVYDVTSEPEVDFCVGVSITGVSKTGTKFKIYPLGGGRTYEFSVDSGLPVLGRVHREEF